MNAGVRRLRPKRRSGQQAEALSRRDRLDPNVRAQLPECVPQVRFDLLATRIGQIQARLYRLSLYSCTHCFVEYH